MKKRGKTASLKLPAMRFNYAPSNWRGLFAFFFGFRGGGRAFSKGTCLFENRSPWGHPVFPPYCWGSFLCFLVFWGGCLCEIKNEDTKKKTKNKKMKRETREWECFERTKMKTDITNKYLGIPFLPIFCLFVCLFLAVRPGGYQKYIHT